MREVIAKVFNGKRKPANLLAMTRFARRFTAKDVAKLADVGWKQMNALLSIKSDEVLFELAAEVNYNRLTTKELKKEINDGLAAQARPTRPIRELSPRKLLNLWKRHVATRLANSTCMLIACRRTTGASRCHRLTTTSSPG